jgi:hypothetical protein
MWKSKKTLIKIVLKPIHNSLENFRDSRGSVDQKLLVQVILIVHNLTNNSPVGM